MHVVVLGRRIRPGGDGLNILAKRGLQRGRQLGQGGNKSRPVRCESQSILSHDDTAVTGWPSSASDDRYISLVHYGLCNLGRHGFE